MRRGPLVLINHLVEPGGRITGITRYTFGLLSALVRRGDVRLALATCFQKTDLPEDIAEGVEHIVSLPHIASTPLSNLNQRRELSRVARETGAEIVYAMSPMCPPVRGLPHVITVHDLYYEVIPDLYHWRHRLWWRIFFGEASRRADRIACASRNTANDIALRHPELASKLRVVAGAGVLPRGEAPMPAGLAVEPYVLLLGNITPNKNAPFLIDALRRLELEGRPVKAYHVGRDLTGDLARALAGDGSQLLTSLGSLDDGALDAVLRHASALVQPSSYEGFGLPIIEAHERGVPAIASDIPVFREVMGDGGLRVPLNDAQSLADAIHRVVSQPGLRTDLSAKALANAQRFTWDLSAAAAARTIDEIFARS